MICILTYGRAKPHLQHTLRQFQEAGVDCHLVVQAREADQYGWLNKVMTSLFVLPPKVVDVSGTRDYLIHELGQINVIMFDDDLQFAVRREDDPTKFRQPTPEDVYQMVRAMETTLCFYPMVGLGAREGGNRVTEKVVTNTRIMRAMGFDALYMRDKLITFAPMELMEDFHVTLQILRSGRDNIVLNTWVTNQAGGSNAPGGCSGYRTAALQSACARKLAGLHPGLVKVVQKPGWKGAPPRDDVIVQWKAARKSAGG